MDVKIGQTQVIILHHHVNHHGKLDDNKRSCVNKRCLYYFSLSGTLICALLILFTLAMVIVKYSSNTTNTNRNLTEENREVNTGTAGPWRVISRKEWNAQPPRDKLKSLELPVSRVIIAHTASENCTTRPECTSLVKIFQRYHMESRGWDDIGYNFLVGGDGTIYVGRGWNAMGKHTIGQNSNSICFAFIGTFNSIQPPKHQLIAAQKMIQEGVKLKKLTANYKLYGHRQLYKTLSPGTALYEIIQKWDHWTNDIEE